jgi:hypothetical protein
MIKTVHWLSYIVPVFLLDFNETLILDSFSNTTQISNVMHICPVRAELFHVDGQRAMMKLTVTFHNYVNVSKNTVKELWIPVKGSVVLGYKRKKQTCHRKCEIRTLKNYIQVNREKKENVKWLDTNQMIKIQQKQCRKK